MRPLFGTRHPDGTVRHQARRPANKDIREHFAEPGWRHSDEETFDDLNTRAGKALAYLEQRPEEQLIVVSHGMFSRILIARLVLGETLTGEECERFIRSLRMNNTGITVLRFDGVVDKPFEGAENPWKLVVWNDHSHLGEA